MGAGKGTSRDGISRRHIGEVAEEVQLTVRALRYYDEVGVVTPSARTQGGFRLYTDADVERLLLVKCMKPLEFSLEEMRDLLDALDAHKRRHASSPGAPPDEPESPEGVRVRLARFRELVSSRVETLSVQLAAAQRLGQELDAHLEMPGDAAPR